MKRQSLKLDIYSQLSSISSSHKRSNLNIDDLIYQFKMRKCNNKLAKQYSEIIKIFDHKQQSAAKFAVDSRSKDQRANNFRMRTDESQEPFQQFTQRNSHKLDIHKIIKETSPIKITPRLNYENFKTFQESVQNSEESKHCSASLAKFGPCSSNQCETDEEIQQISKQSVQKLSKFKNLELELFQQNICKVCSQIEIKNNKLAKQGFIMIRLFSKWTIKEKATKLLITSLSRRMRQYFEQLLIYEKSEDSRRSLNYDRQGQSVQECQMDCSIAYDSNVLTPINMNIQIQQFSVPLKSTNQFGVINFEEYLKKLKKSEN